MTDTAKKDVAQWEEMARGHETMTSLAWRRFRRHPGAIAGMIILGLMLLAALLAPLSPIVPRPPTFRSACSPPPCQHPFGTDQLGRDLLTRCLYGGRVSLTVGFLVVIITMVIGIPIGAIAGYFGGGSTMS